MLNPITIPESMADKRIVVTGATGFVGRHFMEALVEAGMNVVGVRHKRPVPKELENASWVEANLLNVEECESLLEEGDLILHAAGSVGSAAVGPLRIMSAIRENLFQACNMLEAAWKKKAEKLLLFSSSTGYPPSEKAMAEEDFWSEQVYDGYYGYGWMRRYMELISDFSHRCSDLKVAVCRPGAVYGRHDNFDPSSCHVLPALVGRAVSGETPFVVWGDGSEVRDFLHVEDLVRGSLKLLDYCDGFCPMNIVYGDSVTVKDAVEIILESAGRPKDSAEYDPEKPVAMPIRRIDGSMAERELGFKPKISFQQGLEDLVHWYAAEYEKNGGAV